MFLKLKSIMKNRKKLCLQLSINSDKTHFEIMYTRKSDETVSYSILYDQERKKVLTMTKKINNIPDPKYAFSINAFPTQESAEINIREEFKNMLYDISENVKIRESPE